MKKIPRALTMVFIVLTSPLTFASSTDLTVTGLITPNACTPNLSSGGIVDYGKISAKDLKQDTSTRLEDRTLTLDVKCDGPMPFALFAKENRPGSASSASSLNFGLGKINETQKLGNYFLTMINAVADGVAVQTINSVDGKNDWKSQIFMWPGQYMSVAATGNPGFPIPIQHVTLDLGIVASIARADGLDLTNEVLIDGSATLEMNYL
jgi:type 1 fimbria pilin